MKFPSWSNRSVFDKDNPLRYPWQPFRSNSSEFVPYSTNRSAFVHCTISVVMCFRVCKYNNVSAWENAWITFTPTFPNVKLQWPYTLSNDKNTIRRELPVNIFVEKHDCSGWFVNNESFHQHMVQVNSLNSYYKW